VERKRGGDKGERGEGRGLKPPPLQISGYATDCKCVSAVSMKSKKDEIISELRQNRNPVHGARQIDVSINCRLTHCQIVTRRHSIDPVQSARDLGILYNSTLLSYYYFFGPGNGSPSATNVVTVVLLLGVVVIIFAIY